MPFSHLFTELEISPIELEISPIELEISKIQLGISPNRLNCRYLQFNWRYLQINCRYLQILSIWRYLQLNCRYLQFGKSDKISAPRRKNRCAMIQVSGLIKSCIYKYFIINYIVNNYNYRHKHRGLNEVISCTDRAIMLYR